MNIEELKADLLEHAEWADANIYEVPITLPDDIRTAVAVITELLKQVSGDCQHCKHRNSFPRDNVCWHCSRFAAKEFITGDFWEWDAPQNLKEVQNG